MPSDRQPLRDALAPFLRGPVQHSDACPDCDATAMATEVSPGLYRMVVAHDETCPALARMRQASTRRRP